MQRVRPKPIAACAIGIVVMVACAPSGAARVPVIPAADRAPDVVFVPTPYGVVERMLEVARVGRDDVLYDLGSGDGRIVIAAARRFGTRGVGIDIDSALVRISRRNADTAGVARLTEFRQADLFATDLTAATVVTLYLLTDLNIRLRPKLFAELRPGSRVVSHAFGMGDWKADSTFLVDSRIVYYWVVPADVSGSWRIETSASAGIGQVQIDIQQKYQEIRITPLPPTVVRDASIRGDSVHFAIRERSGGYLSFSGRVNGGLMSGSVVGPDGRVGAWRGTRLDPAA